MHNGSERSTHTYLGAHLLGRSAPWVLGRASTIVSSAGPVKKTSERRPSCARSGGGLTTRCGGERHRSLVHTWTKFGFAFGFGFGFGLRFGFGFGVGSGVGSVALTLTLATPGLGRPR